VRWQAKRDTALAWRNEPQRPLGYPNQLVVCHLPFGGRQAAWLFGTSRRFGAKARGFRALQGLRHLGRASIVREASGVRRIPPLWPFRRRRCPGPPQTTTSVFICLHFSPPKASNGISMGLYETVMPAIGPGQLICLADDSRGSRRGTSRLGIECAPDAAGRNYAEDGSRPSATITVEARPLFCRSAHRARLPRRGFRE
jgi:hypothetical protein